MAKTEERDRKIRSDMEGILGVVMSNESCGNWRNDGGQVWDEMRSENGRMGQVERRATIEGRGGKQ